MFIILFISIQNILKYPFHHLLNYIQYFGIGFLLSDFKISNTQLNISNKLALFLGSVSFCSIWYNDGQELFLIISIFAFYYLVLFTDIWKRIFSIKIITVIGGMCYSIYLIHFQIISFIGNPLVRIYPLSKYFAVDFAIYTIFMILCILIISALFYKVIEQPCMKRDWHQQFSKNIKDISNRFHTAYFHTKAE